jgi:hypothetical protein
MTIDDAPLRRSIHRTFTRPATTGSTCSSVSHAGAWFLNLLDFASEHTGALLDLRNVVNENPASWKRAGEVVLSVPRSPWRHRPDSNSIFEVDQRLNQQESNCDLWQLPASIS